ncbi:hypothetical protein [Mycolicibacterium hodleri]|uniref:Uncharacterized protein n=1 Tax=Mycolicibacterium hodleri TaxID=49897 RepID=A0A502EKH1_9MYCO|nr:hypothetical protein [Mycolicibacterium hodleri]TPG36821.1 hypothetical protein EAH80_02575 [Mycolicibacterium hodleri]
MAKSIKQVAAGVGAVLAIVVAGGPSAAVAAADPGSSRSSAGQARDGGRGDGNGSHDPRRGRSDDAKRVRDRRDREPRRQKRPPGGDGRSTTVSAGRGTAVPETTTLAALEPVVDSALVIVPGVSTAPAGHHGPVPGAIGESTTQIVVPVVTFGNGRSPGPSPAQQPRVVPARSNSAQPVPQTPTAIAAPRAPSPGAPPRPSLPTDAGPWPLLQTPMASLWGTVQPGWPTGALFGLAGLLLAPIGGVCLGYRQARAARAANNLVSS